MTEEERKKEMRFFHCYSGVAFLMSFLYPFFALGGDLSLLFAFLAGFGSFFNFILFVVLCHARDSLMTEKEKSNLLHYLDHMNKVNP